MIDEVDGVGALHDLIRAESRGLVIDFWSPWCAPCRTLKPHLRRLAEEHAMDWRFVAVDTESHPAAAEAFTVASLPTLVWMRDGEELSRLTGAVTLSGVAARMDELA